MRVLVVKAYPKRDVVGKSTVRMSWLVEATSGCRGGGEMPGN